MAAASEQLHELGVEPRVAAAASRGALRRRWQADLDAIRRFSPTPLDGDTIGVSGWVALGADNRLLLAAAEALDHGRDRLPREQQHERRGRAVQARLDRQAQGRLGDRRGLRGLEVLVERETGQVRIPHCHGAAYAGRVVNPLRVKQQNEGGAIYGLGPTLFEELVYSGGQLTNPNLSDYMIPSIVDVPERLTSTAVESDDPTTAPTVAARHFAQALAALDGSTSPIRRALLGAQPTS